MGRACVARARTSQQRARMRPRTGLSLSFSFNTARRRRGSAFWVAGRCGEGREMNEHEICGRRGQPESLGGLQRGFRGRASERANRGRRQRGGAHLPKVCAVWGRVGARRRVASRPVRVQYEYSNTRAWVARARTSQQRSRMRPRTELSLSLSFNTAHRARSRSR